MDAKERAEKLAEIRAREEAEAARLQAEVEERIIARDELKTKLEKELGVEGVPARESEDFAIVALGSVLVGLKAPEFVTYKKYMATKDAQPEHIQQFVRSCVVHPTAEQFDAILMARKKFVLANKCEAAIFALMGARDEEYRAK